MGRGANTQRRRRLLRQLRAEHGDGCHWCGILMLFKGDEGWSEYHPMRATFEHLVPRSEGGSWTRTNLRLAHNQCNNDRDRATKIKDHHMNSRMTDHQVRNEFANYQTAVRLQEGELADLGRGDPNAMAVGASLACMKILTNLTEKVLSGGLSARTRHLLVAAVTDVHTELDGNYFKGLLYEDEGTDQDTAMPSRRMPEARLNDDAVLPDPLPPRAVEAAHSHHC